MLSRHIWLHPSTLLDFQYVIVGAFAFSALFAYTLLTGFGVGNAVCEGLTRLFGSRATPAHLRSTSGAHHFGLLHGLRVRLLVRTISYRIRSRSSGNSIRFTIRPPC